jgi:ADP-ribose pyrophosphatase YjhB (NUDIX family)
MAHDARPRLDVTVVLIVDDGHGCEKILLCPGELSENREGESKEEEWLLPSGKVREREAPDLAAERSLISVADFSSGVALAGVHDISTNSPSGWTVSLNFVANVSTAKDIVLKSGAGFHDLRNLPALADDTFHLIEEAVLAYDLTLHSAFTSHYYKDDNFEE